MSAADWIAEDKQAHAFAGVVAGASTAMAVDYAWPEANRWQRAVTVLIPVVLIAVGKEIADHQDRDDHDSDWRDAAATVAGGALVLTYTVRF